MIIVENITKIYKNGTKALNDVSLTIDEGEFVFIIGPSGSGKSTFLKLLTREEKATHGEAIVNGYNIAGCGSRAVCDVRRTMGVVFQDFKLLKNKTAYENIAFALEITGSSRKEIKATVPKLLELVGIKEKGQAYPDELSGGEQQRVALARALANNPTLLIADEPTGNIDPQTSIGIITLLGKINEMGTTVVVATHDKQIVDKMQKRVIVLKDGQVINDNKKGSYSI